MPICLRVFRIKKIYYKNQKKGGYYEKNWYVVVFCIDDDFHHDGAVRSQGRSQGRWLTCINYR